MFRSAPAPTRSSDSFLLSFGLLNIPVSVLTGTDGNAGAIMSKVVRELQRNRVTREEIDLFRKECMSGNYEQLLQTCMEWVNVE